MNKNFNTQKGNLTEQDVDQILEIVCKRCRIETWNRVRSILKYDSSKLPNYGIFERLMKEGNDWSYCAGQSYPDEIRTIRQIMIKGK